MESRDNPHMNELPSLSTSLLDRVQQMQPDAWARMVDAFSPIVYRWARIAGLSGADAADVVQDVFIAVTKNIATFERQKETASFRSWLATITRNRVKDSFRKRNRHPPGFGGTEALQKFQHLPAPFESRDSEVDLENSISLADLNQRLPARILDMPWLQTISFSLRNDSISPEAYLLTLHPLRSRKQLPYEATKRGFSIAGLPSA